MLTFEQKQQAVTALREKFDRANSVIFADYRGLGVPALNTLRDQLFGDGDGAFEYQVVKNSILRRAAEGHAAAALAEHFEGPTALALCYGDPAALAKTLVGFAKEHEIFRLKAGLVDGRALDPAELGALAALPGRDALRAQFIGLLEAPARKLLGVLTAPGAQLARLTSERRAQLAAAADS